MKSNTDRLHLEFVRVEKCVFRQSDWSQVVVGYIQILSKDEVPGLENNFLVQDPEQDEVIRFECFAFFAAIVPAPV